MRKEKKNLQFSGDYSWNGEAMDLKDVEGHKKDSIVTNLLSKLVVLWRWIIGLEARLFLPKRT